VTPLNKEHLARLLGMLGSNAIGERANAASLADRMIRKAGLTWLQVIGAGAKPRSTNTPHTDLLNEENQRLKTRVGELEQRLKYWIPERDGLYRDLNRLKDEVKTAHGMGSALAKQLEHERAARTKEREAARVQIKTLEHHGDELKRFKEHEKRSEERQAYIGRVASFIFAVVFLGGLFFSLHWDRTRPKIATDFQPYVPKTGWVDAKPAAKAD
jgi:hypothetical protein